MPYDSNGNATIIRNRAVTGQTVQAAQVNTPFDDVQSMLSQVLLRSGVAPMTGQLNANGFKIINVPDPSSSGDLVNLSYLNSALASINDKLSDPWWQKPVGEPFPLNVGFSGIIEPPKNKDYRYIALTANQFSAGQYNEGVLINQTISGSGVNIIATATVSLTGSPLNGQVVRLINTEGRFIRPSDSPGAVLESQNLSHNHALTDPGHVHNLLADISTGSSNVPKIDNQGIGVFTNFPGAITRSTTGITLASSGGDESRPRSVGALFYMRIK